MGGADFKYVPHTADVAFIAYGTSLKKTLENSASAMLGLMFDTKKLAKLRGDVKTIRITQKAATDEELFWFTLQEIVSKVDARGVKAFKFKVNRLYKKRGMNVVHGCIFYKPTSQYLALLDVKGVTPHDLKVKHGGGRWSAKVVLDV